MIYYHTIHADCFTSFPAVRCMLLLACSDKSEWTYTKQHWPSLRSISTVSQHPFCLMSHILPFMFLGNTKKWACLLIYLGCLTWIQEEASCLWLSCCLPQALGSWEPVTLMCPICWKQGLSVTAIEQNGSSVKSKRAWFWWILCKHSLYLHLWPGQTYMFT